MRNVRLLQKLQDQLQSLPMSVINRVNRPGGLDLSSTFELVLNPVDHTVDFYSKVEEEKLEAYVASSENVDTSGLAIVLIVSQESDLKRQGVKSLIESMKFPIWISCPPSLVEHIINNFPGCNLLPQYEFISFTPDNYLISTDESCLHPCGTGDSIAALVHDEKFCESAIRDVYLIDLSVARCFVDEILLDRHRNGSNVTAAITTGNCGDTSTVLCAVNGCPQLLEKFLFMDAPEVFDHVHTGHLVFKANLSLDKIRWAWHRRKVVKDGTVQVHQKRYLYDITEAYDTKFVKVPRDLHILE